MFTFKRRVHVCFRRAELGTGWEQNNWRLSLVEIKAQSKGGVPQVEDNIQKQVTGALEMTTLVELPTGNIHLSSEKMSFLQKRADALGISAKDYIHILSIRLRPYLHLDGKIYILEELIEHTTSDILDRIDSTFRVENGEFNLEAYDMETVGTKIQEFVGGPRS